MRLRKLTKMRGANDGSRRLIESIMAPEMIRVLRDWKRQSASTLC